MNKVVFITGMTATGKSDLAIWIAKKFNGEIINADSRQVYKYLDIGSGKITKSQEREVKHYLLSIKNPKTDYSLGKWLKDANNAIKKIYKKNKLPIICGGTILYLKALKEGWILPKVTPDYKLRRKLEKLNAEILYERLKRIDPERAENIDPNNKRRIIRALEISIKLGKVPKLDKKPTYKILIIAPYLEFKYVEKKIYKRLIIRIQKIIKEILKLKKIGLSFNRIISFGLEYKWFGNLIKMLKIKKINKKILKNLKNNEVFNKIIESCYKDIRKFAKKQYRELRKIENVHWIKNRIESLKIIKNFLK